MRVVFYLDSAASAEHRRLLAKAVAAAYRAMPGVPVIVLADEGPGPFALRRARAQAEIDGETLFLDVDCELRASVADVFRQPFDVALPEIRDPHVRYTGGVVFCRGSAFWRGWARVLEGAQELDVRALLERLGQYTDTCGARVQRLDWRRYEYLPVNGTDPCAGAAIVHYRGPRKAWFDAWAGATN